MALRIGGANCDWLKFESLSAVFFFFFCIEVSHVLNSDENL